MNRFKSYLISGVLLFAVLPAHAQSSAASLTTSQSGGFWSQQMHKLGAQYFNFATTPTEYANKQDGRLESFNYVGLDYHIDYDRKISLRIPFLANMNGSKQNGDYGDYEFKWADLYLNYADNKLFPVPGNMKLISNLAMYFSSTTDTQDKGQITRVREWLIFDQPATKSWDFLLHLKPEYSLQSRTGYLDSNNSVKGNKWWGHETDVEIDLHLNRTWTIEQQVGISQYWSHAVAVEGVDSTHVDNMLVETGLSYFYSYFWIVGGVTQKRDVRTPRVDFALYRPEETQYFLRTLITL